jgi:hypothetical protein
MAIAVKQEDLYAIGIPLQQDDKEVNTFCMQPWVV